MDKTRLTLVDGSSYLYRAYHAMPSLTNAKREPTGAIYGVINMLRSLIAEYPAQYFVVIFDAKGKNFRHDLYSEYKANRPPMPDDLRCQIEPLNQLIKHMGFPMMSISGVEADDVIGTLATKAAAKDWDVLISTGDKDLAQLVNDRITLINTMSNDLLNNEGVMKKFGVPATKIIDYLALMGDTSDNIPGVPKVGPKTAVKWLNEYESMTGVMANASKIKGKVGENLKASLEQLPLSYQLATIKCDVDVDLEPSAMTLRAPDIEPLKKLLSQLGFKSWLAELLDNKQAEIVVSDEIESHYHIIDQWATFERWVEQLKQAEIFAFDTETTSLNYLNAQLVGLSFATVIGEAAYVPLAHNYLDAPTQLDRDRVLATLKPILEDAQQLKVGQNLKYDQHILKNYNIQLRGIRHDTMLESYVLDSTGSRHDMNSLALQYLAIKTIHFEDVAGKGAKQLTFNQVPIKQAGPYAAEDADITLRLHQKMWPKLQQLQPQQRIYEEIEIPLLSVLNTIERNGVLVDNHLLAQQSNQLALRLAEIEQQAYDSAGEKFNLNSPKQIQYLFYEKLGLPVIKKTPKKQPSTSEEVLKELALDYPLPKLILEHRGLSKLKSTYTDRLPEQINPKTGRVHTSYHQAVTATGRLSSSDPNLQNIPIRSVAGREIRQAFIASPGYQLVAADYSQIELRIMAHLSQDQGLLNAFSEGQDIHSATAAEVFQTNLDEVTINQRRSAKAINFGLIYGMSAFGLAKQLGIDRNQAKQYIEQYFNRYPGVKIYMETTRESAKENGYVETLFGRRLYLPEINASNAMRRQYAERTAINAPMQGTAADIIKRAMITIDATLQPSTIDARMIMQVHDELVFEVETSILISFTATIQRYMNGAANLDVPLIVDIGVGDNWDEAH